MSNYFRKTNCHFHPNKQASKVCSKCLFPICDGDSILYRKIKSTIFFGNSVSALGESYVNYDTVKNYCIVCYSKALGNEINPIIVGFKISPFLILSWVILSIYSLFAIILIPFIVIFIIIYFLQLIKYIKFEMKAIILNKELKYYVKNIKRANRNKLVS